MISSGGTRANDRVQSFSVACLGQRSENTSKRGTGTAQSAPGIESEGRAWWRLSETSEKTMGGNSEPRYASVV